MNILSSMPTINPLTDLNLTFDHFYQFVKKYVDPDANQLIQMRAAAEPVEFNLTYPWFSYYSFLCKIDTAIAPTEISENATSVNPELSVGQLSYEYGRFLKQAVRLVEIKELPPETNQQINSLEKQADNLRAQVNDYVTADAFAWPVYAKAMGFPPADMTAMTQWWFAYGHADKIRRISEDLDVVDGQIDALRLDKFADADQEEIFTLFTQFNKLGSRIRWPRLPDTMYKDGVPFTVDYLARLPPGGTPLFADRHFFFISGTSLGTLITSGHGGFSETLHHNSQAKSSIDSDWHANGSASYAWFSVSADASQHTSIKRDLQHTDKVTVSCKSLQKLRFDATPWFSPNIFKNSYVKKNPKLFQRYFGPTGTLRFFPSALVVARGMKLEFESTDNYNYDYKGTFSANGSGSIRVFGIGFGGGAGGSSTRTEQIIESQGHKLTLDDGEQNFRVVAYVLEKVDVFDKFQFDSLKESIAAAAANEGAAGLDQETGGASVFLERGRR